MQNMVSEAPVLGYFTPNITTMNGSKSRSWDTGNVAWNYIDMLKEANLSETNISVNVCLSQNGTSADGWTFTSWNAVITFFASVVVTATLVGNILVIAAVCTERKLRKVGNYFLVNLGISDLLVGVLVAPFALALDISGKWGFGSALCYFWTTTDIVCCTASIMNLCIIGFDRYKAITDPLLYAVRRTPTRAGIMIGLVWVYSLGIAIPPICGWGTSVYTQVDQDCRVTQSKGYTIFSILFSFVFPLTAMIFLYWKMFKATLSRKKTWMPVEGTGGAGGSRTSVFVNVTDSMRRYYKEEYERERRMSKLDPVNPEVGCRLVRTGESCPASPLPPRNLSCSFDSYTDTVSTRLTSPCLPAIGDQGGVSCLSEGDSEVLQDQVRDIRRFKATIEEMDSIDSEDEKEGDGAQLSIERTIPKEDAAFDHANEKNKHTERKKSIIPLNRKHNSFSGTENNKHLTPIVTTQEDFKASIEGAEYCLTRRHPEERPKLRLESRTSKEPLPETNLDSRQSSFDTEQEGTDLCSLSPATQRRRRFRRSRGRKYVPTELSEVVKRTTSNTLSLPTGYDSARSCSATSTTDSGLSDIERSSFSLRTPSIMSEKMSIGSLVQQLRPYLQRRRRHLISLHHERQAAKTLGIIVGGFILCWLPFFVVTLLQAFIEENSLPPITVRVVTWLGYCNSALNPIIYTSFNPDFRKAFKKIVCFS